MDGDRPLLSGWHVDRPGRLIVGDRQVEDQGAHDARPRDLDGDRRDRQTIEVGVHVDLGVLDRWGRPGRAVAAAARGKGRGA
jgi:hypothetical protein